MIEYRHFAVPDVWLHNGYERRTGPHGPTTSYEHVEQLEHRLRLEVLRQSRLLTPTQVRFLRVGLDLTQAEFAARLGVDPQSVARWEKGRSEITPIVDFAIRALCLQFWEPERVLGELNFARRGTVAIERIDLELRDGQWMRKEMTLELAYDAELQGLFLGHMEVSQIFWDEVAEYSDQDSHTVGILKEEGDGIVKEEGDDYVVEST